MTVTIEELRLRMEKAAEAMDFEEASRLRDRISLLRGAEADAPADIDTAGLERQQPGRMGLGTSQQAMTPPKGWKPPKKPDPMTEGRSRPRGGPGRKDRG
ncbi:MAG TPA: UvrB/UvrC motif-containing protein [Allosphingosinicella sp.]|nr:UvrB/UvrC motif-containing protein [Allosphingosinicella sp.]